MASVPSTAHPSTVHPSIPSQGEPAWDVAMLYPAQGQWSDLEYLLLTEGSNRLVELTDGHIEVLEMPTSSHQRILLYLLAQLQAFIQPGKLGEVLCAPLRVRLREGKIRKPDIVFMLDEHRDRLGEDCWNGADLVIEVVSKDLESRKRDLEQKPLDYAEAAIPEYWIVDPQEKQIAVLTLEGDSYATRGVFGANDQATSKLLEGFEVNVAKVFEAAKA